MPYRKGRVQYLLERQGCAGQLASKPGLHGVHQVRQLTRPVSSLPPLSAGGSHLVQRPLHPPQIHCNPPARVDIQRIRAVQLKASVQHALDSWLVRRTDMDSSNANVCTGFTAVLCPQQQHTCTVTKFGQKSIKSP